MPDEAPPPNGRKALNTLIAIVCVSLVAFVGIFAVATFGLDGDTLKFIIGAAILAIGGLGGYEIREQFKIPGPT